MRSISFGGIQLPGLGDRLYPILENFPPYTFLIAHPNDGSLDKTAVEARLIWTTGDVTLRQTSSAEV